MRKKLFSVLLTGVLSLSLLLSPALAADLSGFTRSAVYSGQFTDLPPDAWYTPGAAAAYELGLINGTTPTTFSPSEPVTLGTALALACRLHSICHTGAADFVQGDPWYQVYLDYALANGILTPEEVPDCNATATRRQFAGLLARSLPPETLTPINDIPDNAIPDLIPDSAFSDAVYTLYRAGVLTGNDINGTFTPEAPIDRAGAAVIVTRMADPALRRTFTLVDKYAPLSDQEIVQLLVRALELEQLRCQNMAGLMGDIKLFLSVGPSPHQTRDEFYTAFLTRAASCRQDTLNIIEVYAGHPELMEPRYTMDLIASLYDRMLELTLDEILNPDMEQNPCSKLMEQILALTYLHADQVSQLADQYQ